MSDLHSWQIIAALAGSFLAGVINTLAGNGSAITLTIMTELLGMPGNLANGTNRIGVLSQGLVSTWGFTKRGKIPWADSWRYTIPAFIGALAGVWTAVNISNEDFLLVFRYLMIAMLFVIIWNPARWLKTGRSLRPIPYWAAIPLFGTLGFYGGFIQMGMGIFLLAALVLIARFELIAANGIKIVLVTGYTIFVLFVFWQQGLVDWRIGLIFALGQSLGGWAATRFAVTSPRAGVWAYRLLIVIVLGSIASLMWPEA